MRNVKNTIELNFILDSINNNRFCLKDALLDSTNITGNKINNLDINEIEYIVENEITAINLFDIKKESRNKNRIEYLIEGDIYINDNIYRVKNWFSYLKNKDIFEDSGTLSTYIEEGTI